jgi:nicotinamide-nucleotide adenylyltransferase
MGQYRRLVVPGRFQPPHEGHVNTIRYALSLADEVIVIIGSAQDSFSIKNPLTAGERYELLDKLLKNRLGRDYCERVRLVPVPDIAMNKVWVQYLKMLLPPFDGVVSGNQLVLMLFEDMDLVAIKPPLIEREECSGTRIREHILRGEEWEKCVPPEIRDDLRSLGFEHRLRRLLEDG